MEKALLTTLYKNNSGLIAKTKMNFKNVNDSILIIGAQKDERAPIETNAKHYHKLIESSNYIELKGDIGHYIFMNEAKSGLKRGAPLIFKDSETINRIDEHHKMAKICLLYTSDAADE